MASVRLIESNLDDSIFKIKVDNSNRFQNLKSKIEWKNQLELPRYLLVLLSIIINLFEILVLYFRFDDAI
jgi:hypothetical protein